MEYNTQRHTLKISDYGRNIYKLIQYTKTIEDRERRTQMAAAIVDVMARSSSDPKTAPDYKRKYWVHLMILSNWELDVDVPYSFTREETVEFKPNRIPYAQNHIRSRHFGATMDKMIKKVAEYPEGEERDQLVGLIAHTLKRNYLLWNNDTVEDDFITHQLEILSDGKLHLPANFQYYDVREYLKNTDLERRPNGSRKKKKKKKSY